jgi:hypothetical protein
MMSTRLASKITGSLGAGNTSSGAASAVDGPIATAGNGLGVAEVEMDAATESGGTPMTVVVVGTPINGVDFAAGSDGAAGGEVGAGVGSVATVVVAATVVGGAASDVCFPDVGATVVATDVVVAATGATATVVTGAGAGATSGAGIPTISDGGGFDNSSVTRAAESSITMKSRAVGSAI